LELWRLRVSTAADYPMYLVLAEAVGFVGPWALIFGLLIKRRRQRPAPLYHVWTLLLTILCAGGGEYARAHRPASGEARISVDRQR
jgi:hypothetical protein